MSESLFDKVMKASELSPIFARFTIERALRRASVEPAKMGRSELQRALPELRRAVEAFVPDRIDEIMGRIEQLTRV